LPVGTSPQQIDIIELRLPFGAGKIGDAVLVAGIAFQIEQV
jgi:hypothetical protein